MNTKRIIKCIAAIVALLVFLTTSIMVLADEKCMPFTSYDEEKNELGIAFAPVLSDKHSSNAMQKKIDWTAVKLEGLKTNSNGSYYLATQSEPVCFQGKVSIHCLTVTSSNTAAFNFDENDLGKLKLYDSEEFTQDHLVSFPENKSLSFNQTTVKQYPDKQGTAMGGLNIEIPGMNYLQDDQTYYLVIEKGFTIREGKTLPTTVALKFNTGHSYVDDVCTICGETKPKPSNNWITFQEGVSYLSSDEQNDYYRIDDTVALDSSRGFVFSYNVDGAQRYCHVQLQKSDGSTPEEATVSEPDGTSRTATVTSLDYGSNYQFFWNASESNGKLSKNVILKFSTEEDSSEPEPDIPDYEQDLVFGDYAAIQPSDPAENSFGLYFYAIQPSAYNTNKLQESLDASSIKTAGLISIGKEQYFFNSMEKPVCPDVDQYVPIYAPVSGKSFGTADANPEVATYFNVYSSSKLTKDSLVASSGNGTIVYDGNIFLNKSRIPLFSEGGSSPAIHITKGILEHGKTYYLVVRKGLTVSDLTGTLVSNDNYILRFTTGHSEKTIPGKDATCTEAGTTEGLSCSACGSIITPPGEIPAKGHTTADAVKENEVAATCTKEGSYDEVVYCSVCKEELSRETKKVDKLSHTEEVIKGTPATCTAKGMTDGKKCSICGEVLEAQEEIPALGHKEEVVKGKAATCTEKGLTDGKKCSVCGEILEEQKEIPALGHTEEVVKGKAATCTEKGLTDGKKCSVCGEVLEEQKEIPAKGHTSEVIEGKAATCTETGLTDGEKCSVCGKVLKVREDIPALGHDYKDGKCSRCGEADPSVKPVDPVEPSDTKLVVKNVNGDFIAVRGTKSTTKASDYTGIAPEVNNRKVWWRVVNGEVVPNATGVFKNEYGWWRVENGTVNFKAQEIYRNQYGWWKTTNGKVTFDETGVYKNFYGWWRVEDSKVNFKANGIYKNQYGWWKTTGGKVTFKENGVFKNEYGWWKVENSKVNFKFTGIAKNEYGTWYVKNGKVDFSKNGKVAYNGKTYQVTNGKAKLA